ncbi:MAG: hypothetical protein QM688_05095 [Sphingomonas bacterium]
MSHDQRPARMRLVGNGAKNAAAAARKNARVTIDADARIVSETGAPRGEGGGRMAVIGVIVLFLIACAAGGAGFAFVSGGGLG